MSINIQCTYYYRRLVNCELDEEIKCNIIVIVIYLFTNSTTEHDRDRNYEQDQQGSTSANSG